MSEELSFQEVEELLEGVINNTKLCKLESKDGDVFVIFSHPPAQDIIRSRHARALAVAEAGEEGLPSREDIEKVIEERKKDSHDDDTIAELEGKIEAQNRLLSLTKIAARREPIEKTISGLTSEVNKLTSKYSDLYALTKEFRADELSTWFLAWVSTYTVNEGRYWESFESFEANTDLVLRNSLMEQFAIFNRGLPLKQVRFLARHVLWRIRYTSALKIGGPLFPRGLFDLTSDQQSLLYWSNYYQSIYEMLPDDMPDEDIINDDEALDSFMEVYFKRKGEERNEGKLKKGGGKLSTGGAAEVIVTPNNPEYLGATYSEKRIKSGSEDSDVEVISPMSRRARNRRTSRT